MKKNHRTSIILILFILTSISLCNYFYIKQTHPWNSLESRLSSMIAILSFDLLFFSLMFLIDFNIYKQVLKFFLILALTIWGFTFSLSYFKALTAPLPWQFWIYWDIIIMTFFSMLAPGLVLYIIHYIKTSTGKYEENTVFGYHLHEGFFGIVLLIGAIIIFFLREFLAQFKALFKELSVILAIMGIFLYLFLYISGFFIFRDWHDVLRLKIIEKKELKVDIENTKTPVFNNITHDDLHFFQLPRLKLYPLGILFTLFSLNAIIFANNFLPMEIFKLKSDSVILLGFLMGFIAGGLIGRDWLRVFKRFYPKLYGEIDDIIIDLKFKKKIRCAFCHEKFDKNLETCPHCKTLVDE